MYRVKKQLHWESAAKENIFGNHITVGVLDTGIARHPDLKNRIVAFQDFIHKRGTPYDDSGHGTHVCGILAGDGRLSNGKLCGIAPKAKLVVGKILDEDGHGTVEHLLEGIYWIIACKEQYGIRILNISIGANEEDKEIGSKLIKGVELAWDAGITVVTAAGNNGPGFMTISAIGASSKVITVGCHEGGYFKDRRKLCEDYSGRGPTEYAIKKPDLVAPGTEIVSCNGNFVKTHNFYKDPYSMKSGTSMATPIVSGVCALCLEKYPRLTNEELKRKLVLSARDLQENWTKQGWGMVDVENVLKG